MSLSLSFYQDVHAHECAYLPDELSQNLYPDPTIPMTNELYSQLIKMGFRRSGNSSYRPHCPECQACIPVRINVNQFKPNRSQRRCLKRNEGITRHLQPAIFKHDHFALYSRYLNARHAGAGMDNPTSNSYRHFLLCYWSDTLFVEFRHRNRLVGVAVTDQVDHALSAFYTLFDPDYEKQSLGTYAILQQIEMAKSFDLPYLYLGYWIADCQKMAYKQNFSGLEGFIDQEWKRLDIE